ncbi:tetratricopeptide repeat (TPR)-like superfamily protein [Tasmannia lanceolata]|uniref:tetratricopeptide repeat (TPR)-like superfamily protein n=1 Tax=Tasmannia lanceolata TaxID=3420 RepID=UPI004063623F
MPFLPGMRNMWSPLNLLDLSTLLSISGKQGHYHLGSSLHGFIIKNPNLFTIENHNNHHNILSVWNSLISMYSKCGQFSESAKVFELMRIKDTITWNSMIWGCLRIGELRKGFGFFQRMRNSTISQFDQATLTTILSACNNSDLLYMIRMIHSLVISSGFELGISVGNALISAYSKCECLYSARQVFDEMPQRNVVTWTAVISGLAQSQFCRESLVLFSRMRHYVDANSMTYSSVLLACSGIRALKEGTQIHGLVLKSGVQCDLCIESALMDMYCKCNMMEDAYLIFESSEELDEVSMTVILVGLAQNGLEEESLELFIKIMRGGIEIDENMVSAVLGVFGVITSLGLGKQIHSLVIKKQLHSNQYVGNGLINMYSKCGEFGESIKVFGKMAKRNSVSWNSMIAGFARHGHGLEALQFYEKMKVEGAEPTDVTFLSLLHACSHAGAVENGMELLESMSKDHGIKPRMEHYACVVDMLGRAGQLNKAKSFIEGLEMEPGVLVWQALLGASSICGNSEMGEYAAHRLLRVAPECSSAYVLMANIYSSQGRWEERAMHIKKMKEMGVRKETGMSWIEVEKQIHSFVVEDRAHPQAEIIYEVLDVLIEFMGDEGYVPDKRFLLYDMDLR